MEKRAQLWKLVQDVRASYWFLPSLLVLVGLLLAWLTEWIDLNPEVLPISLPATFVDSQADGARSTLAVIAQSIIGVTGVMFSMTLVAVSFASGNFGPRLIGNFMRDRGNQWSLGILISTFVYAVVVLSSVQDDLNGEVEAFVPQYSLLLALVLTLVCVFTLIFFIHHVPETINVSRISAGLGNRLEIMIRELIDRDCPDDTGSDWHKTSPNCAITATNSGYIQTCNMNRLRDLATDNDLFIQMQPDVGDFVTTTTVVFAIWSADDLTEKDIDAIRACYAVGTSRTENQNPTFLAEQLVEMAARALSPGLNDPYTAQDCLNRLAAALTVAMTYQGGLDPVQGERVRAQELTFERLFAVTFPLCRQYVRADTMTRTHALRLLDALYADARHRDKGVIEAERQALSRSDK